MPPTKPELLIVGTGALATFVAARLSADGVAVTMLGTWEAGLSALNRDGAQLQRDDGTRLCGAVRATADPRTCANTPLALVLVKAWQTERAAAQLAQCLATDGLAVSLQNGLGNRESLARHLGPGRVGLGVTTDGATLLAPGVVRPGGDGTISLEAHSRMARAQSLLQAASFQVESVPDAQTLVWGKLVVSAAINPLTALLDIPNGALLERPDARAAMADLAREAAAVATALGVGLSYADPVARAEEVAMQTARNLSSMLQDVRRGAPTEIDAICGALARLGDNHAVPTPANRLMWRLVRALVRTAA